MTYTTLLNTYPGPISGAALTPAASAAWGYLLGQTLGRITALESVPPALSQCFSALVQLCHDDAQATLTSETVGDFRREYRDDSGGQTQLQRAAAIIRQYLGDTDLLYRGVEP